jgi:hypothetical protein
MADTLGIGAPPAGGTGIVLPTAPAAPVAEFVTPPPAAAYAAAAVAATVLGRNPQGALLVRTVYGTLALQTSLSFPPGSSLELRLLPGQPPAAALVNVQNAPEPAPPPMQLTLGTTVEATVLTAASSTTTAPAAPAVPADQPAVGTHLLLRIVAPTATPSTATLLGRVAVATTGETLIETPIGTLALSRRLGLPPGTTVAFEPLEQAPTPTPLALGTATVEAVVQAQVAPPAVAARPDVSPLPVGARLLLRIIAPPAAPSETMLLGRVVASTGPETMVETPVGLLALGQRLGLLPGTSIAFEWLEQAAPPDETIDGAPQPSVASGWSTLDQALDVLDRAAPTLAGRLRTALMPSSGPQLAGTLLFLMGALYGKGWPGDDVDQALSAADHDPLRARLSDEVAKLQQLAANPATGDWRVLVLPLINGAMVQPIRLYLRRRDRSSRAPPDEGARFIIEVEMTRLGPLQLDGLMRNKRFDLVLRSHRALPTELRRDAGAVFHQTLADAGLAGDIAFVTASPFAVAPLAALRDHVQVSA